MFKKRVRDSYTAIHRSFFVLFWFLVLIKFPVYDFFCSMLKPEGNL